MISRTTITLDEALKQIKGLGNEKMRAHNTKYGAGDEQFGVKHGDIRVLAKKIKTDHQLARASGSASARSYLTPRIQFAILRR